MYTYSKIHAIGKIYSQVKTRVLNKPEKSLEILRQLGPTRVTWVHGDEDAHCLDEADLLSLEDEARQLVSDSILDGLHLDSHHG